MTPDDYLRVYATRYRIIALNGGGFGVEVVVPGTEPAMVVPFETTIAAKDWIADHKARPPKHFRRAGSNRDAAAPRA
jgi:hypothetical protein